MDRELSRVRRSVSVDPADEHSVSRLIRVYMRMGRPLDAYLTCRELGRHPPAELTHTLGRVQRPVLAGLSARSRRRIRVTGNLAALRDPECGSCGVGRLSWPNVDAHLGAQLPSPIVALDAQWSVLGDTDLRRIAKLRTLERLELADTMTTRAEQVGLDRLAALPALEHLTLTHRGGRLSNALLTHLPNLDLRALRLRHCTRTLLTTDALRPVEAMPTLERLTLGGDDFTDALLSGLCLPPGLRSLWLACPQVTSSGLRDLQVPGALNDLSLIGCLLFPEDVSGLCSPALERLELNACLQVSDATLEVLGHELDLSRLRIVDARQVTDWGLADLAQLEALRDLDLTGSGVRGLGLLAFRGHHALQTLRLGYTPLHDSFLNHLAEIPHLERLELDGTFVSDRGLAVLANLPGLKRLELSYCEDVTDAGLDELARAPALTWLDLNGCDRISDEGFGRLRDSRTWKRLLYRYRDWSQTRSARPAA